MNNDNNDCRCVAGQLPVAPAAPGVQECVDAMNQDLEKVREEQGLFETVALADLVQLEDQDDSPVSSAAVPTTVSAFGQSFDTSTTTSIDLAFDGIKGTIPTDLGLLTELTALHLWGNSLNGGLPTELGLLTGLQVLWVSGNFLTGTIH